MEILLVYLIGIVFFAYYFLYARVSDETVQEYDMTHFIVAAVLWPILVVVVTIPNLIFK